MSDQSQDPPSSTEDLMEQLAAEFGIDLGALEQGQGDSDPYAIFAEGVSPSDPVGTGLRPRYRPGAPLGDRDRSRTYTGDQLITSSVGAVLKKFYELSPSALRRMQALLYAGGFYGDADVTDVAWGEHDDASFTAWSQAVARTARLNAAGKDVTYQQVIGDAAFAAGLNPESLGDVLESGDDTDIEALLGQLAGGEGRVIDVVLSDPNALRATVDRVSSAVLGRKANAAEQRMFISMIHDIERKGQIARQTAEPGTIEPGTIPVGTDPAAHLGFGDEMLGPGDVVTEYAPPDAEATAEALTRQQNPDEAGAHDIAIQFASFLEMLPAPVSVPRLTL